MGDSNNKPIMQTPENFNGPTVEVGGGYKLAIINPEPGGNISIKDWINPKHMIPEASSADIIHSLGRIIGIAVLKNGNTIAVASGFGTSGNKNEKGEIVISNILHNDGSINEFTDDKKFKVKFENKLLTQESAEIFIKEFIMGMGKTKGAGKILSEVEPAHKYPVAKVELPHDFKAPSQTTVAGKLNETKSLS